MRKLSAIVVAAVLLVALAGCGGDSGGGYVSGQIEEAYAFSHGGYVARAVVRVLDDGSIDVDIDEAFLPSTLAAVDVESAEWNEGNTVSYVSHGSNVPVAKYIEYDGTAYVGTTVGSAVVYVEAGDNGEPVGGTDLNLAILRNQASMAAYYNSIQAGSFKVLTEFGGQPITVDETHYGGVTKVNAPGYWNTGQTWQGNIDAIEAFIEENGAAYSLSEMVRASEANADGLKLWSVADAVTGATNSDFKDYFGVVQTAMARLKTS